MALSKASTGEACKPGSSRFRLGRGRPAGGLAGRLRMLAAWSVVAILAAVLSNASISTTAVHAADSPVHLIVADMDAFGGNGGLIDLNLSTGATRQAAANGWFVDPYSVVSAPDGFVYVADREAFPRQAGGIIRVNPATGGQLAITSDQYMVNPSGVVMDANGNLVVVDPDARNAAGDSGAGGVIRVNVATGEQTLVSSAGLFSNPTGIAIDSQGPIYVADNTAFGGDGGIIRVNPTTGAQTEVASNGAFGKPSDLVVAPNGDIYVIDQDWDSGDGGVIRLAANTIEVGDAVVHPIVSGNEVSGHDEWGNPTGITLAPDGKLYVANPDRDGIYSVDPSTKVVTKVSSSPPYVSPTGLTVAPTVSVTPPPSYSGPYAPVTFNQPADSAPSCTVSSMWCRRASHC